MYNPKNVGLGPGLKLGAEKTFHDIASFLTIEEWKRKEKEHIIVSNGKLIPKYQPLSFQKIEKSQMYIVKRKFYELCCWTSHQICYMYGSLK